MFIGTKLYGYCNGFFGDSYEDKRIEAIGVDWIVTRDEDGDVSFAYFEDRETMIKLIKEWSIEEEGEC